MAQLSPDDLAELRQLAEALAKVGQGLAEAMQGVQVLMIVGGRAVERLNIILAKVDG